MKIEYLNITRRVGLIDLFNKLEFKSGVEIGTDRGGYAKDILERMPSVDLYTIDPYQPYNEGDEVKDTQKMIEIENEARNTLSKFPNCRLIVDTSMNAVKLFHDNSIDFVFIDGNHEYEYVLEDITEWTKKVRPDGIIAGHDYKEDTNRKYGVVKAVHEYCEKNGIEMIYILKKGTYVPCWMFYKPL